MKQIAFAVAALLAISSSEVLARELPFNMQISYDKQPQDSITLDLEIDNELTLRLPSQKKRRRTPCTGWELAADND